MTSPSGSNERRRSRRYPPAAGRNEASITCNGCTDVALVLNISSSGMRVRVHADFPAKVGDAVVLKTADGRHVARIVNIAAESEWLELGLERLEDRPHELPQRSRDARERAAVEWSALLAAAMAYVMLPLAILLSILAATIGFDGVRALMHTLRRCLGI